MATRIAIIGGDAAGMGAAAQARRLDPSAEIVAFERGEYTSYSACGIPYLVSGQVADLADLVVRSPQEHRDRSRIDVRMRHEVVGIDVEAGRLEVRDHQRSRTFQYGYDQLVIGTGARPVRPDLPGIDGSAVFGVQTLGDAARVLQHLQSERCGTAVVVGGGYIGLEMAEAMVRRGLRTTLIDGNAHLMGSLDAAMAHRLAEALRNLGVDVRNGVRATGFEPGRVLTDHGEIPAEVVVLGIGVQPNATLADEAGLALGVRGSIVVDRRQQTSAPGVWAAGDCCQSQHLVSGKATYLALGTVAAKQARVVGTNLGGGYATFPGVVGTAVTKVCQWEVARTGLTEREANAQGFATQVATVESTAIAGYLPEAPPITVAMIAEQGTGRVLGAQILGGRGSAKRIDVVATALTARMTVHDVAELDLGYAPPLSPLWDPVAITARKLTGLV